MHFARRRWKQNDRPSARKATVIRREGHGHSPGRLSAILTCTHEYFLQGEIKIQPEYCDYSRSDSLLMNKTMCNIINFVNLAKEHIIMLL